MEIQGRHDHSRAGSSVGYEAGFPVAERGPRAPKRKSLRREARRRRILANLFFVASSAVVLAVVGICYAFLRQ
jgi:hypothetical protein